MQRWLMEQPFNFNKGSVSRKQQPAGPLGQGQNVRGDQAVTTGRGGQAPNRSNKGFILNILIRKVSHMLELKRKIKLIKSKAKQADVSRDTRKHSWKVSGAGKTSSHRWCTRRREHDQERDEGKPMLQNETGNKRCDTTRVSENVTVKDHIMIS